MPELALPQLTQFLLAACTKTTDNHPPVTVQDQSEVGLIHTRPRMDKVNNSWWTNILHRQLPALSSTSYDLGSSVASIQNVATSTKGLRLSLDRNMNQRHLDIKEKKKPTSVGESFLISWIASSKGLVWRGRQMCRKFGGKWQIGSVTASLCSSCSRHR